MREIILDTETTGLSPQEGHRLVEIGCVEVVDRVPTGRTYQQYIRPDRAMSPDAQRVHGLSDDFLKDFPPFHEIAPAFLEFIDDAPLVIHNAAFDMKFIHAELTRISHPTPLPNPIIDTLLIARKKYPGSPASLDALCKRFSISIAHRTLHGALLDCHLLALVYTELSGHARRTLFATQESVMPSESPQGPIVFAPATFASRLFPLSAQDKERHAEFIRTKIKNALWKIEG